MGRLYPNQIGCVWLDRRELIPFTTCRLQTLCHTPPPPSTSITGIIAPPLTQRPRLSCLPPSLLISETYFEEYRYVLRTAHNTTTTGMHLPDLGYTYSHVRIFKLQVLAELLPVNGKVIDVKSNVALHTWTNLHYRNNYHLSVTQTGNHSVPSQTTCSSNLTAKICTKRVQVQITKENPKTIRKHLHFKTCRITYTPYQWVSNLLRLCAEYRRIVSSQDPDTICVPSPVISKYSSKPPWLTTGSQIGLPLCTSHRRMVASCYPDKISDLVVAVHEACTLPPCTSLAAHIVFFLAKSFAIIWEPQPMYMFFLSSQQPNRSQYLVARDIPLPVHPRFANTSLEAFPRGWKCSPRLSSKIF